MAISLIVSEIFNVDRYRDLEIIVRGSIKVIESGTIRYTGYCFLLVFYSNFIPKMRYSISKFQKCHDLESRVKGPLRSLKTLLFDKTHMTSY